MNLREKHKHGIFTVTVELDPPKSSTAQNVLREAGLLVGKVDAINIADCPMAKLRMSPIALSYLIQEKSNIETIFHLTCRDRNIIGLQSELLGAAALGVHNILTLTGDPPLRGDHPHAKAVFEVDSTTLMNIARHLNEGVDFMGNALETATHFYIGTAGNPGVENLDEEIERLELKIENGANFIQTQPIYDIEKAKLFMEKASILNVPILLGLIPLKSFKMATYLHEKVAGISISDEILHRMEQGGKEAGLEIAKETLEEIKKISHGVHIMPLNDIPTVLTLLED